MNILSQDQNVRIPDGDDAIEVIIGHWEITELTTDHTTYCIDIKIPALGEPLCDMQLKTTITYYDDLQDYDYQTMQPSPLIPKELYPHIYAVFVEEGPLL